MKSALRRYKKPPVPKKKAILGHFSQNTERELLAPTISSRKVMEPPPLRNVKHGWKSSGKSSPKIGMLYLHGHVWKKLLISLVKKEILCVCDSDTIEAEFYNSIFRASFLLSNGQWFIKTNFL